MIEKGKPPPPAMEPKPHSNYANLFVPDSDINMTIYIQTILKSLPQHKTYFLPLSYHNQNGEYA
jgi:hypothetical protein